MTFKQTVAPGNEISLGQAALIKGELKVVGSDNTVVAGEGSRFESVTLEIKGDRNLIRIGPRCKLRGKIVLKGEGLRITLGAGTTLQGTYLLASEGSIEIGMDCMFSRDIEVRTDDAHSIIDVETGRRVNAPGSIRFGDHVWVGLRAIIQKGVTIPPDCIIGAGSFVNRSFNESNVAIAGVPARIVKRGVTWDRRRQQVFDKAELWANAHALRGLDLADEDLERNDYIERAARD